jgi:hypothetical protein
MCLRAALPWLPFSPVESSFASQEVVSPSFSANLKPNPLFMGYDAQWAVN